MVDYQQKIMAELEQIERTVAKMPHGLLSELNYLELSGVGGMLHSFYNGVENILKQMFLAHDKEIPKGVQWHKEMLNSAVEHGFISEETLQWLIPFLTFRHLYRNAYALELDPDKMQVLADAIKGALSRFAKNICSRL